MLQIKRIIHLKVQSKPMYLRTLLYALRQGVALGRPIRDVEYSMVVSATQPGRGDAECPSMFPAETTDCWHGSVPDHLLDSYLTSEDSISLTSKVLDVYAAYIDEGEVSVVSAFHKMVHFTIRCRLLILPQGMAWVVRPQQRFGRDRMELNERTQPTRYGSHLLGSLRSSPDRARLQIGASIMGAVLSVLYAARNGLMDDEVRQSMVGCGKQASSHHQSS